MSGRPLSQRIHLGPVELDRYLAGQLQGLAYMRRLRAIEEEEARHLRELEEAWRALADEATGDAEFALAWREAARGVGLPADQRADREATTRTTRSRRACR